MSSFIGMEQTPMKPQRNELCSCCTNARYHLWLDRQISPVLGAIVNKGEGQSRPEVEDDLFLHLLKALTRICKRLIPNNLAGVYFTYPMGSWQQTDEFFLKAHLTTSVFLSLTDKLCSPEPNPVHSLKVGLLMQEQKDHHGEKLRELFAGTQTRVESRCSLQKGIKYHIATVTDLNYPMLCLYQSNDGDTSLSADVPATQLPEALEILETFVAEDWGQEGFSIGMIISTSSNSTSHASATGPMLSFQIAAIVEEEGYARHMGMDEMVVKNSWSLRKQNFEYPGCKSTYLNQQENLELDEEVPDEVDTSSQ